LNYSTLDPPSARRTQRRVPSRGVAFLLLEPVRRRPTTNHGALSRRYAPLKQFYLKRVGPYPTRNYCIFPDHHLSKSDWLHCAHACLEETSEKQNAPPGTWRRRGDGSLH